MAKAKLTFGDCSGRKGFVAGELGLSDDRYPPGIIREIVQNSLDAAVFEKHSPVAQIRFYLDEIEKRDIPGIKEYKQAVENIKACYKKQGKKFSDKESGILETIENALKKPKIPIMLVMDNGIGFDTDRMDSILSNGSSEKESDTTSGSRGNGHFATFSLSNLRYLLYGGISKNRGGGGGVKVFSGHAILASQDCEKKDADGRYIIKERDLLGEYVYCALEDIPSFFSKKLDFIEKNYYTGSIVGILGFSGINGSTDKEIAKEILAPIAKNFFVAVHEEILEVEVIRGEKKVASLKKDTLNTLIYHPDPRGKKKEGFPSRTLAGRFYQTFCSRNSLELFPYPKNKKLKCRAYASTDGVNKTKIAFCRNGMWITQEIPEVGRHQFRDYKPFQMLITCDKDAGDFHRLIRQSENNLHTAINLESILKGEQRQELTHSLQAINRQIAEQMEKQPTGDEYQSDAVSVDVLGEDEVLAPIDSSGGPGGGTGNGGGGGDGGGGKPNGPILRIKKSIIQKDANSMTIHFISAESYDNVAMQIGIHSGKDSTCAAPEKNIPVEVTGVARDGQKVSCDNIGPIEKDRKVSLTVNYKEKTIMGKLTRENSSSHSLECVFRKVKGN